MGKLKIAVLFSGGASSLRYLMENDSDYSLTYEVVFGLSNKKDTKGELFCKEKGIPFEEVNTKEFCIRYGYMGRISEMPENIRKDYFYSVLHSINEYKPNIILLSGFMLKISKPLLGYCPIINVHPADLRIMGKDGKPKYTGDDTVTMAIQAGERFTASTIHVVEREVDCGRIICVSKKLPVTEGVNPKDHQERMKTMCDGPAYEKAIRLIAKGEFIF